MGGRRVVVVIVDIGRILVGGVVGVTRGFVVGPGGRAAGSEGDVLVA